MNIPKFLLGDHSEFPDAIYVIHTEFPRFIINLVDDSIAWQEDLKQLDAQDLEEETVNLIKEASQFYDEQVAFYEED